MHDGAVIGSEREVPLGPRGPVFRRFIEQVKAWFKRPICWHGPYRRVE